MLGLVPQHLYPFVNYSKCFYFTQTPLWSFARPYFVKRTKPSTYYISLSSASIMYVSTAIPKSATERSIKLKCSYD